jgi:hypothetical protein
MQKNVEKAGGKVSFYIVCKVKLKRARRPEKRSIMK